ncbi:uncharacterized protein LOC129589779 isoform X2 [Paramacrobiotus metropolitanus]|uniref:uncharacterized protein LOC129589779 isoform X2 n=1 Tax=Paramacrobiotus metropolitanus TaxID=2943436 RepID=UPI0024457CFC|nr:uncharacterized protein LOC129589779 isoform X2 [Paramacrobiotus metropolitanus]
MSSVAGTMCITRSRSYSRFVQRSTNTLVNHLILNHVSPATRRAYNSALNQFIKFCRCKKVAFCPASVSTVLAFIAFQFAKKRALSTVRVYLAAISDLHCVNNLPNPVDNPSCTYAFKGYARLHQQIVDSRLPITPNILVLIKNQLVVSSLCEFDKIIYWCAFVMIFCGFLRIGELLALNFEDICVAKDSSLVSFRLSHSKTDQLRRGHWVHCVRASGCICPVRAVQKCLRVRFASGAHCGRLFVDSAHRIISRSMFLSVLKYCLRNHPNVSRFNTHSFRIGAATTAARRNVPAYRIKEAGRWKSDCYQRYIRDVHVNPALF